MSKTNTSSSNAAQDAFLNSWKLFGANKVDMNNILDLQKESLQTLQKAQRIAWDTYQEIRHRQNDTLSQMIARTSELANETMREGKPEDKLSKNVVHMQKSYENAIESAKEISELIKKANEQTTKLFTSNTSAALEKMKKTAAKS